MPVQLAVPAPKLDGAQALLAAWPEPGGEAGWARAARTRAARRLAEGGAPVRRDEYWRFTDPSGLTRLPALRRRCWPDEKPAFDDVDRVRLVFVDGVFAPELSDAPELAGVEIQPLCDGARHRHPLGARALRRSSRRAARSRSTGRWRRSTPPAPPRAWRSG